MKTGNYSVRTHLRAAFTLIEIMIVVAIIGMLATMALPAIQGSMNKANYNAILNNLKVIDNQKTLWSTEHKSGDGKEPSETDLAPYFNNGRFPSPIIGEHYNINPVGTPPTATIPTRLKMPKMTIEAGGTVELPQ